MSLSLPGILNDKTEPNLSPQSKGSQSAFLVATGLPAFTNQFLSELKLWACPVPDYCSLKGF